jgi:hypothetical protein
MQYLEIEFVFVSYVLVVPSDSLNQPFVFLRRCVPDYFCLQVFSASIWKGCGRVQSPARCT